MFADRETIADVASMVVLVVNVALGLLAMPTLERTFSHFAFWVASITFWTGCLAGFAARRWILTREL